MSSAANPPGPGVPAPLSSPPPGPAATVPDPNAGSRATDQLVIYHHSNLFYWWPVWLLGLVFALVTYMDNDRLALVPAKTTAALQREVDVDGEGKFEKRDVLIVDANKHLWAKKNSDGVLEAVQPTFYMTHWRIPGSIFVSVLLFVVAVTNIHVRGLWTVFLFVVVVMVAIMVAVSGYLMALLQWINQLSVFVNLGGYLLISIVLLGLWLLNFFVFDRQTYMVFTPGQVRIRLEIGGEETVYDSNGIVVQRERSDIFRHFVLGFGAGDLIIKPVGQPHPLIFPNVLRIEKKVAEIERMVKQRVFVNSASSNRPSP